MCDDFPSSLADGTDDGRYIGQRGGPAKVMVTFECIGKQPGLKPGLLCHFRGPAGALVPW